MMNIGHMKVAAIRMYNEFLMRVATMEDEGYRRYRGLLDFVSESFDSGDKSIEKSGAEEGEERTEERERGERQQERFVGRRGMGEAFARWFRDMLEDYVPGGYTDDPKATKGMYGSEGVRALTDDFYRLVYKGFSDLLPKMVSQKLKAEKVYDVGPGGIKFTSELINRVITDAVNYFHKNPNEIKSGLIKAYTRKFKDEGDEGDVESRDLGVGQAFFKPRVDQEYFKELQKKSEATGEEVELQVGDVDSGVLKNLESVMETGTSEVRWRWRGIDENGMLHFTMPELYGGREFVIRLPVDIENIRPGTYPMRIRSVKKNGAIVEFPEQRQEIHDRYMGQVRREGLGVDQLRSFINNGFINRYVSVLRSEPVEKLIEDFGGQVTIGGEQVGSVDDLAELGEGGSGKDIPKARGSEKIERLRQELQEEIDKKTEKVKRRWEDAPALQKMFMSMSSAEGTRIADVVADQFPSESEKGTIGLDSILSTRPVVHFIMRTIMDPTTPMGGRGKADPWITLTINHIRKNAVHDPVLLKQFTELMRVARTRREKKQMGPGTKKVLETVTPAAPAPAGPMTVQAVEETPVSVADVQAFINSIPENIFRARFNELKKKIQDAMHKASADPALRKFFDRWRSFKDYKDRGIGRFVNELLYLSELDPSDPEEARYRKERGRAIGVINPEELPPIDPDTDEGRQVLDRQVGAFINRTVKKMQQPGLSVSASMIDPLFLNKIIVRAYHLVTSGQMVK